MLLQPGKEPGVSNGAVFHDFGQAGIEFPVRKRCQGGRIDHNSGRLVESADEILALFVVDGGFSAHRCIHLGQQCRRCLQETDSPHVTGSSEAGDVPDHAAPEGNDVCVPASPHGDQLVDNSAPGFRGFERLSIGDYVNVQVTAAQGGFQRFQVQWRDHGIADDQGFTATEVSLP